MHPALLAIRSAIHDTAYHGAVWLVGGAVRDELLGKTSATDLDLVLESDANAFAAFLFDKGVASRPPEVFTRFGTAMVLVEDTQIEIVTARRESYREDSRKPDVEPATLKEDALRRDFTCNAILKNLTSQEFWDPLGIGMSDIRQRVLRTPLEPAATFSDDPLRMLRAIRFRWRLGFTPAAGLYAAIRSQASRLTIISEERIRDEFCKIIQGPSAPEAIQDLLDLGLLAYFAPELPELVGVEQGHFHHLDAWGHTLAVLRNVKSDDLTLRLAALWHDVGKASTRTIDQNGRTRFFGHEVLGEQMVREWMNHMRFPGDITDDVALIIRNHMRFGRMQGFTESSARRVIRDLGEVLPTFLDLVEADSKGLKAAAPRIPIAEIREVIDRVKTATPKETLESPLSGIQIMEITGWPAGPMVGRAKLHLLDLVLEGRLAPGDRDGAEKALLEYMRNLPG